MLRKGVTLMDWVSAPVGHVPLMSGDHDDDVGGCGGCGGGDLVSMLLNLISLSLTDTSGLY
jgi:hypothetical protein